MALLSNEHTEERPWGSFEQFTANEESTVKILNVLPGLRFSLQTHEQRNEYWRVVAGTGIVQIGDLIQEVGVGNAVEIPAGTPHRLTAGPNGISVLEIALGTFDENDIVRLEDDFGRVATDSV